MTGPKRKALRRELIAKLRFAEALGDTDAIRNVIGELRALEDTQGIQVTPVQPWGGDLTAWQRQRGKAYTPPPPPDMSVGTLRTVQNIAYALEFARGHERNFDSEVRDAMRLGVALPNSAVPPIPEMSEVMVRLRTDSPEDVERWVGGIARAYAERQREARSRLTSARREEAAERMARERKAARACLDRLNELELSDTDLFGELQWAADKRPGKELDEDDDD